MVQLLPVLLVMACESEPPEACGEMCHAAAGLYGGCIEQWGLDWLAVGYDDEPSFVHSCETWAWEARLLSRDTPGWLHETCDTRRTLFEAPEATCADYTNVDWSRIGASP